MGAELAVPQARRHDPRVTRVGRVLRRTSLDELPQLFNVLTGEMSLVGPRPHALAHDARYAALIAGYADRYRVPPGITGWAQVNGFRGKTDTLAKMQRRVDHDLAYVEPPARLAEQGRPRRVEPDRDRDHHHQWQRQYQQRYAQDEVFGALGNRAPSAFGGLQRTVLAGRPRGR